MKIDRLLGILILLLNRKKCTARELAETFEVSERTIYRDIDSLGMAGVPVLTEQGAGGGVGLAEGFTLDRQFLKNSEIQSILLALRSVAALINDDSHDSVRQKVESLFAPSQAETAHQPLSIDFLPWGDPAEYRRIFSLLHRCIDDHRLLKCSYMDSKGDHTERRIEPYQLAFKGYAWYLRGYCLLRNEFRMFKLGRMDNIEAQGKTFTPRPLPPEEPSPLNVRPAEKMVFLFSRQVRARVFEYFGKTAPVERGDKLEVTVHWPLDEWVYSFILGFGPLLEVLSPPSLRKEVARRFISASEIYKEI